MLGHGYLIALKKAKSAVYGPSGEKIGVLGNIFMDVATGDADFVTVHVGLFGSEECFVSLAGAGIVNGHLVIPFDKNTVKHAPNIDPDKVLSDADKNVLESYYAAMNPKSGS